jgi:hypothetical protein
MKILRSPKSHLVGEFRTETDVVNSLPGELVVVPMSGCQKPRPDCLCQRAFVGASTGLPTTLAVIDEAPDDECVHELLLALHGKTAWDGDPRPFAIEYLARIAAAINHLPPGMVLRTRRASGIREFLDATGETESAQPEQAQHHQTESQSTKEHLA